MIVDSKHKIFNTMEQKNKNHFIIPKISRELCQHDKHPMIFSSFSLKHLRARTRFGEFNGLMEVELTEAGKNWLQEHHP